MPGWTGYTWAIELVRKAWCCERDHSDIAAAYRKWAKNIGQNPSPPAWDESGLQAPHGNLGLQGKPAGRAFESGAEGEEVTCDHPHPSMRVIGNIIEERCYVCHRARRRQRKNIHGQLGPWSNWTLHTANRRTKGGDPNGQEGQEEGR